MPTLRQLEDQARELSRKQLDVVNDETRPWSERKPEFDGIDTDLKGVLEQHTAQKGILDVQAQFDPDNTDGRPPATGGGQEQAQRKSLGELVTDSAEYQRFAAKSAGSKRESGTIEIDLKDLTIGSQAAPGNVYGGVTPTYLPGVQEIRSEPLTVRQLFAQGVMSGPSITYLVEESYTNNAAMVPEGGLKPQSELELDQRSENARKIATILRGSDEAREDVPYIISLINARGPLFISQVEEFQLLNGDGTGNNLPGLLGRAGRQPAQVQGSDTLEDAIFKQITKIRTKAYSVPSAIVMSHGNWEKIRLRKDANAQYLYGSPQGFAYGNAQSVTPTLWGVPVVATAAMPDNRVEVGAFATDAQVLQRSGLSVELTTLDGDDWSHNRFAVRFEERLALAVYRPGGFGSVTPAV